MTLTFEKELPPFWNTQSTYWTSSNVTSTSQLGYTYPEFNNLDMSNTSAVQTAISRIVNQLYGGSAFNNIPPILASFAPASPAAKESSEKANGNANIPQIARSLASAASAKPVTTESSEKTNGNGNAQAEPPVAAIRSFAAVPHSQNGGAHPELAQAPLVSEPSTDIWEWTARIRVKKYEVGTSFSIPIFLGSVPDNSGEWLMCEHFVGAHHAFVNRYARDFVPWDC